MEDFSPESDEKKIESKYVLNYLSCCIILLDFLLPHLSLDLLDSQKSILELNVKYFKSRVDFWL